MMEDSDVALVARARDGDEESFRALVELHSVKLFRLAYRMTGNEQDAEDVVQESFLRAFKNLRHFESRAGFGSWLHRIAANCSLDLLRKRRRRGEESLNLEDESGSEPIDLPCPIATPDQQLLRTDVRRQVEQAMEQLTAMERTAFALRHFEGRSIEEIGLTLGAGPSATKQSIFRAVQKMRRSLDSVMSATP